MGHRLPTFYSSNYSSSASEASQLPIPLLLFASLISAASPVPDTRMGKNSFRSGKYIQGMSATSLFVASQPEGDDRF